VVASVFLFTAVLFIVFKKLLQPQVETSWWFGIYLASLAIILTAIPMVAKGVLYAALINFLAALIVAIMFLFLWSCHKARFRSIPDTIHSLEVRPEGLVFTTQTSESLTTWEKIDRIVVTKTHAFLGRYILPRRAFAGDRDFEEFVGSARSYHEAARTTSGAKQL
jgi:hypothetical protein